VAFPPWKSRCGFACLGVDNVTVHGVGVRPAKDREGHVDVGAVIECYGQASEVGNGKQIGIDAVVKTKGAVWNGSLVRLNRRCYATAT
jgi:hypothetical protein